MFFKTFWRFAPKNVIHYHHHHHHDPHHHHPHHRYHHHHYRHHLLVLIAESVAQEPFLVTATCVASKCFKHFKIKWEFSFNLEVLEASNL